MNQNRQNNKLGDISCVWQQTHKLHPQVSVDEASETGTLKLE